jgi:hypothetical protein
MPRIHIETNNLVPDIINAIIEDLEDRAGLGDEWEMIDEGTQAEIQKDWGRIIQNEILDNVRAVVKGGY